MYMYYLSIRLLSQSQAVVKPNQLIVIACEVITLDAQLTIALKSKDICCVVHIHVVTQMHMFITKRFILNCLHLVLIL